MTSRYEAPTLLSPEEERHEDAVFERVAGTLFGAAIADAMGWATEFVRSKDELAHRFNVDAVTDFVAWEKRTGGRFNTYYDYIQAGEYSDDTQLALCTARSLLPDGSFEAGYFAKRELPAWLDYARGAGASSRGAARAASRKTTAWNDNFFTYTQGRNRLDYRDAGANGAAMRVAPIALANVRHPDQIAPSVFRSSIVTHGHPRAILGALVDARAVQFLAATAEPRLDDFRQALFDFLREDHLPILSEPDLRTWHEVWNAGGRGQFEGLWAATVTEMVGYLDIAVSFRTSAQPLRTVMEDLGCFNPATRGSGSGTVAAAIALFLRYGGNFEHVVTKAVNQIGTDTDTIGAMAAGLCGAYLGYTSIPERWASRVQDFTYLLRASEALTRIAMRQTGHNALRLDTVPKEWEEARDVLELSRRHEAASGMRVRHPLLGLGRVMHVDNRPMLRRQVGSMLQTRVSFDVGQS
ncbi:MAG: ADP-ribosylglycohydrolase family protein, partial [Dehalococcoidia bacterium]